VLDTQGVVIGEHDGAALYTRGQRHGFRTHSTAPLYVVSADVHANTLTVSPDKTDTLSRSCTLRDMHWIGNAAYEGELLDAQSRYHAPVARITLSREAGVWHAHFAEPELLSPGQSLVLYRGDECLGGGIVDNTRRE
jgi:tRNA-specific 2-thiouridylase